MDATAPSSGDATTDTAAPSSRSGSGGAVAVNAEACGVVASSLQPFGDLSAALGLDEALVGMRGHAGAAGDVNGDGWVDLFVGGFADRPIESYQVRGASGPSPDRLLLGSASGFTVDPEFPEVFGRSSGAAFADLDADGDLDLVVARNPRDGERSSAPSEILENDGGRFRSATVLDTSRGLRSIGVLDFDGDGLLDLFAVEDRFSGGDSLLLRNVGGLGFTDATEAAGLPRGLAGLGVAAADLDRSGTPDLFIAGDNRLFLNRGGRFEEASGPFAWELFGDEDDVAGVAVGDVDGNGWLDLVVGQHFNSTLDAGRSVPVRLYLSRGLDGSGAPVFEDATEAAGIVGMPTKAPHVELVDLDGDGQLDIVTSASAGGGTIPAVLMNRGGATPTFTVPDGLGSAQYWVAGAVFDLDAEPGPEIFVVEWEPSLGSRVFDGPQARGSWISVQVGGSGSGGVGAIVEIHAPGERDAPVAVAPIVASTGYGSGSAPVARAGIGSLDAVDVVVQLPWGRGTLEASGVAAGSRVVMFPDGRWGCAERRG